MIFDFGRGHRPGGGMTRTYGLGKRFAEGDLEGPPPNIDRKLIRRVAGYFRPYLWRWGIVILCICTIATLTVLPPFCVGLIIDKAIPNQDVRLLAFLSLAMVAIAIGAGLVQVLEETLTVRCGQGIMFDLRNAMYRRLQQMSLNFYTSTRSGEIVSRVNNDVGAVQGVVTSTIVSIVANIAVLTTTSIALFSKSWRLALLALAVVPAFYLPSKLVGRIRRRLSTDAQESQATLLAFLNERMHVGGAILANIFGRRESDASEFRQASARVRDLSIRQTIVGRWLRMVLMGFSAIGPAVVYWYGGFQAIRGDLTPGTLVAFAALLERLYRPLIHLATVYADIQGSFSVFERIFEYLDMRPEVEDRRGAVSPDRVAGHVEFQGVAFAYPRRTNGEEEEEGEEADAEESFALRDVSFEIRPGEQVALVGPSGAGKSTVTYLVPRFYDPAAGRVLLDGHDLRDLSLESLRKHIGMVTQETFMFHATIRENLLYARPGASEEEMIEACRAANIHEFICALPDKYDSVVGERGFRLSGGEKQRLSIARAILKDPSILILDEATSSLDATSEYLIQTALEKLLRGRTSLIIAHRLSTILSSDKIVVLERGRVVETGNHEELLERRGLYASLYDQQFGKVLGLDNGARIGEA